MTASPPELAIVGWHDGGAGQVQGWLESSGQYRIACFVHPSDSPPNVNVAVERSNRDASQYDFPEGATFKGRPLLCVEDWPSALRERGIADVLIMHGDAALRLALIVQAHSHGFRLIRAVHPTVTILDDAILHENVVLYPRALVGYRSEIFTGATINTGAQIDHHNVIRPCATIDPGVVTAGNVTVGDGASIHTGAVVKNRVRIGQRAVIGAGTVVIRDVPADATVVGVPGRVIKIAGARVGT